jgi:outer membrane protein TolC
MKVAFYHVVVRVILGVILSCFSAFLGTRAWAEEGHIGLATLIEEAKRENPDIKRAKSVIEAARAIPKQVSTLPNPELSFGLTNIGSRYSVGNDPMSMLEVGISQPLPYPKKLHLLGQAADAEADAADEAYHKTLFEVISRLKSAYFDYWLEEETRRIFFEMLGLFKALRGDALVRYEVGEAIQQDVLLADIEIDRIKERLELLNPEKERLQAEINALLNRPPSDTLGIPERLEPAKLGSSLDDLVQTAKASSPAVQEMHRLTDRDRIRLSYAKAAYIPDFRLSAGYGDREGLSPQWSVGLGIELPLYFWRKEVYGVKEAAANLVASKQAQQDTLQGTLAQIRTAYSQALTAKRLASLYSERILPKARAALESSLASYSVGRLDFLGVMTNATTLLEYEIAHAAKIAEAKKAIAQIEELTGVPFGTNENNANEKEP